MHYARILTLSLLVATATCLVKAAERGGVVLSERGEPRAEILVGQAASAPERFAAAELQKYIEKISGACLPVRATGTVNGSQAAIVLGTMESNLLRAAGAEAPGALPKDSFLIRTAGEGRLILAGTNPRAVLYAVYTLLEEFLGVGWAQFPIDGRDFGPADEVIPRRPTVRVGPIDRTWQPRLAYRADQVWYRRGVRGSGVSAKERIMPALDLMAKNRLNTVQFQQFPMTDDYTPDPEYKQEVWPEVEKRGFDLEVGHHDFYRLLKPTKELFAEHPEYFALVDGKRSRTARGLAFCLSNPAVVRLMAEHSITFLDHHPEVRYLDLWPEDSMAECECAACKKMGRGQGPTWPNRSSAYYLQFVNHVAQQVRREHPDIPVVYLAYLNYKAPPPDLRPGPGVVVRFCNYFRCYTHPVGPVEACAKNNRLFGWIRDWQRSGAPVIVYAYYYGLSGYLHFPYPILSSIDDELRFYEELALNDDAPLLGVKATGGVIGPAQHALNGYAFARMAWDRRLTGTAVLDAYCTRYFGRAGNHVRAFYRTWTDRAQAFGEQGTCCITKWTYALGSFFTEEFFDELEANLSAAEAAAASDAVKRRLAFLRQAWYAYPLRAFAVYRHLEAGRAHKKGGRLAAAQVERAQALEALEAVERMKGIRGPEVCVRVLRAQIEKNLPAPGEQ